MPGRPVPEARHFALTFLAYLAFVVYGSMVPLDCRSVPLSEALGRFQTACRMPIRVESRSDWATNILLFIPLSFLGMAALCVDRPRPIGLIAGPIVPVVCMALSAAIEFAQIYVRSRTTSPRDIVAETIGGTIGTALWLAAGPRLTAWARRLRSLGGGEDLASWLLPGYFAFVVLVHLMPLDLTISPVELYHKYRGGGIRLVRFASTAGSPWGAAAGLAWSAAYFAPLGVLLALRRDRGLRDWPRVLGLGLLASGLVEGLQLFVVSRTTDASSVVIGGLSVLAGWAAARHGRRWRPLAPEAVALLGGRRGLRVAATASWCGVLLWANWWPFDFELDAASLARRLDQVSWIPLADYYAGTELNAFDQILRKGLLSLPVGVALATARPGEGRGRAGRRAFLAGMALAAALELGQLALPGRCPSVTDVIIGGAGAWLGCASMLRLRAATRGSCNLVSSR